MRFIIWHIAVESLISRCGLIDNYVKTQKKTVKKHCEFLQLSHLGAVGDLLHIEHEVMANEKHFESIRRFQVILKAENYWQKKHLVFG